MKKKTTEQFIVDAKQVHGNRYDYSKVEYINAHTKICIICPTHGEFWQKPNAHLNGCGCPKCKAKAISERQMSSRDEFIKKANIIHGNKYDYSKVKYVDSQTKVCIICPIHGEFWQRPTSHLRGQGCPTCSESLLERAIAALLKKKKIEFIREYKIKSRSKIQYIDFYLPDRNIAIECQGLQHFEPIDFFDGKNGFHQRIINDNLKSQYCIDNDIKLIYYTENYNIKKAVGNEMYGGIYKKDNIFTNLNEIYDQF